jgi:D-alanine-D-alanine ligase-like ATP-grasp enzyme
LSLFGADFIKDYQGNYYIVDVNYLPGYKEFTDLGEIF